MGLAERVRVAAGSTENQREDKREVDAAAGVEDPHGVMVQDHESKATGGPRERLNRSS